MGCFKWLKKFRCKSKCSFNIDHFNNELINLDLSKYQLTLQDMKNIQRIAKKRPSVHVYTHNYLKEITAI